MRKILIVVPAFNESATIVDVIKDLKKNGYKDILVVNDGSLDKTYEFASRCKVMIADHVINRGLGAALGTGFAFAKKHNFSILVTFDADGQHKAKDIKKLVNPLIRGTFDVVIGSRFCNWSTMPFERRLLNVLSNFLTFFVSGIWTTDSLSGLRAFNRKAIENIRIKTDRMEVSNEFFQEIGSNWLKMQEIQINAIYTKHSLKNSKQEKFAFVKIPYKIFLRFAS